MVLVRATFNALDGSPSVQREVELELRGEYVHMRGGPTGYESAPARELATDRRDWWACVGTPGRWAECVVSRRELDRAMPELVPVSMAG